MNIFRKHTNSEFEALALDIFKKQAKNISVYFEFIKNLGIDPEDVHVVEDIPFLPVEFFKTHKILSKQKTPEIIFTSSGTTGMEFSRHFVSDLSMYRDSLLNSFQLFYGDPKEFCFLALLPSYLEREGSSLVYMVNEFIKLSNHPESGFYLDEHEKLVEKLKSLKSARQKTILLGVSFALMDLAEKYPTDLGNIIIMETGGMKGRRKEITRQELHNYLCDRFQTSGIHSEYGMTELLSQSYSSMNGIFYSPPWMKIIIKDIYDPFKMLSTGETGLINIIDLANINSCSFIATSDLGKMHPDGSFEVLGRFDPAEIRGCNLMVE